MEFLKIKQNEIYYFFNSNCMLLFSCSVTNISTKSYSSLKLQNINGPVKLFEQKTYSIDPVSSSLIEDTCCILKSIFDKKGRNIKQENSNSKTEIRSYTIRSFYSNGLIKEGKNFNGDGKLVNREVFELDSIKHYKGGTAWGADGKISRYFKIMNQTEFGSWSTLEWYTPEMKLIETELATFDGHKLLTAVTENTDGKIIRNRAYKYNEKGDRIEMNVSAMVSRFRYDEYDKYGNWVKRTFWNENGKAFKVEKREFTYRK